MAKYRYQKRQKNRKSLVQRRFRVFMWRIRKLSKELEHKSWISDKTNAGLQTLYKELEKKAKELERLTNTDPLTQLLNRRGLEQVLLREIEWNRRHGASLIALLIDVDNFKNINDTLGHPVGDVVLQGLTTRLKQSLRKTDYLARIGGDEFVVLLPQIRPAEAQVVAEKLRLAVSQDTNVVSFGDKVHVTASIGGCVVSQETSSVEELLSQMDVMLLQSKQSGKNKISYDWIPADSHAGGSDGKKAPSATSALAKPDSFYSLLQPIIRLKDEAVVGYEMLSRSSVPNFEIPVDFFRAANEGNFLTLVDHHCFKACLYYAKKVPKNMVTNINLFPSTLLNIPTEVLLGEINESAVKSSVCIELSEQQMIGDPADLVDIVKKIKAAGIKIAIDDVGFGRTCLESLILLEPEVVKIDKRYILNIAKDTTRVVPLKRLVSMVESLNGTVIAEGVETNEDKLFLQDLDVEFAQGYYFGRPAPENEIFAGKKKARDEAKIK